MKQRVIAVLLILLLLTAALVTAVFAEPDPEDETGEPAVTAGETEAPPPESSAPSEAPEPVETSAEPIPSETEPAAPIETEPPATEAATEPATEPSAEPEPQPEPSPAPGSGNRLTLRVETAAELDQDLLFSIRGEELRVELVIPAGSSSATVVGLPAGSYTVELDSGWNWMIEPGETGETIQTLRFGGVGESRTVTFRPEMGEVSWLNDYARGDGT